MNRKIAILCFLAFALFYGVTSRADLQLTDEAAVFASAVSLAEQGNLSIDELRWLDKIINLGDTGVGGHLYAKYFPGNIFSAAAVYRLAQSTDAPFLWHVPQDISEIGAVELASSNRGARVALALNAVFGALAMTFLLLLLLRRFDWKTALVTVLFVGVGTDWWYQSRGFLSEVGAGALLIASLYFADRRQPHASGLTLGLSLLFRPTNLIGLPIWLKAAWDKKSLGSVWGILLGGFGLALFNWIRFASPLNFGYREESFTPNLLDGLYGVLLSPGRSLFLYSPILTLAIPGAWLFYKKQKSIALAAALTAIFYILLAASWHSWDGGWSWGSRLLTPILPLLGFLSAPAIDSAWGRRGDLAVALILALLGFGVGLMALAANPLDSLVNAVVYNGVDYNLTVNSVQNSWLALQIQSLKDWRLCRLDAYALRLWLGNCGG
ncbi:MAG: hypothetical protein LDL50_01455 [Chloroflexi bacterium]|nr:hypothetical protein [Chloroflexota bacterium]MCA2000584.1 hypothetical protein [Chloroflexota bacterium]